MPNRAQQARPFPIPAPVGGLDAVSSLATMPPANASVLTNLFPYADRVETRAGYTTLATGSVITALGVVSEGFRNLMAHYGTGTVFGTYQYDGGGVLRWFRIYSIASDGTLTTSRELVSGAQTVTSLGGWTNFISGSGTSYLLLIAWRDTSTFIPQAYDGSNWSSPAITGISGGTVKGVHSHRGRLWFYGGANGATPALYYLPIGAISGAAISFNIGPFLPKGGIVVSMQTWTIDGGDGGTDDLAVFITSTGHAVVYAGYDPASSATWSLVGVFDLGALASYAYIANDGEGLVNDTYALKTSADLVFLSNAGLLSANKVLRGELVDRTISKNVDPLITASANTWSAGAPAASTTAPNWKMALFQNKRMLLLAANAPALTTITAGPPPVVRVTSTVYAMNIETGAWCTFSNMNIRDVLVVPGGNSMYFIDGSRSVYKYDGTALDDAGTTITYEVRQAYNYLNAPTNKLATLMQPMLRATGNFSLTVEADADFNNGTISAYTNYTVSGTQNLQPQLSPSKYGRAFAAHLKGQTSAGVVSWYATNWLHIPAMGA